MASSTVARRGTDSSGRGIYASEYMWAWWLRVCDTLGFTPTIVQGAWMTKAGGGAAASAGYHDRGGSFDLRTWDLTAAQVEQVIRVTRQLGAGSWVRDQRHGMDPHIHFVLGSDHDLASGARTQWNQYLSGRNGLASNGPDYHWRPSPMVTTPPKETDYMATSDAEKKLDRLTRRVDALGESLSKIETYLVDKKGKVDTKRFREERARGVKAEDLLERVLAELEADASGEARGR